MYSPCLVLYFNYIAMKSNGLYSFSIGGTTIKKVFILIFILLFLLFIRCSKNDSDIDMPRGNNNENTVSESTSSMDVFPESGGTLSLPTSAGVGMLEIPPGALDQKTTVTISSHENDNPNSKLLSLEPSGLSFKKPVRLTVSYTPKDDGSSSLISLIHISDLNETIDVGHELHNWAPLENIIYDDENNAVSGELRHFSTIYTGENRRVAYLILDLPAKYLRPGDGLFVLSGGLSAERKGKWRPGHAGMVRSVDRDLNDLTVIESTIGGGPNANVTGVQTNPFLLFKRSGHLYMGARRPKGTIMSDGERITAIGFADLQLGKPYLPWGKLPFDIGTGWICTGLLEAGWKKASHPTQGITDFIPMPAELFEASVPINKITIKVGEEMKIPIYPVILTNRSFEGANYYQVGVDVTEVVSITGQPENAKWEKDFTHPYQAKTLVWKPEPKDAGITDTITFQISGSRIVDNLKFDFNITQELIIHVQGGHKYITIYPVGRNVIRNHHAYYVIVPQGAKIAPGSQEHLIDLETGEFPVNPIFRDQVLENFREEWYDEDRLPGYWGPKFQITRTDNPFTDSTPTGLRSWLYWIDYEVILYDGL